MKLYGIKNCDSVKKARVYLDGHNVDYEFIDFRDSSIGINTINELIEKVGMEVLVNKRSTTYRGLSDAQKSNITPSLILDNITLIKRPVVVNGQQVLVGFKEDAFKALI